MNDMADMGMKGPKNTLPMMAGTGPYGPIGMGGMFTIVKVREGLTSYEDPGWYQHPAGTLAERARDEELRRDGIDVTRTYGGVKATPPPPTPTHGSEGHRH